MADEMVLATQKWLNATYGDVPGFGSVPENGLTGWPTIYGLIRGLQADLGIGDLVDNFGPMTEMYYDEWVTGKWGPQLHPNFVHLIQGAFWCKGISPGAFDGIFSQDLVNAVNTLQTRAGFVNTTGVLNSMWAKALFDMSAFANLGDPKILEMQQYLNRFYYNYTGILPCDGIFQRDTNYAIVYGFQAELGLSPSEATGTFGPTTQSLYSQVYANGIENYPDIVRLLQFALYSQMVEELFLLPGIWILLHKMSSKFFKSF